MKVFLFKLVADKLKDVLHANDFNGVGGDQVLRLADFRNQIGDFDWFDVFFDRFGFEIAWVDVRVASNDVLDFRAAFPNERDGEMDEVLSVVCRN